MTQPEVKGWLEVIGTSEKALGRQAVMGRQAVASGTHGREWDVS